MTKRILLADAVPARRLDLLSELSALGYDVLEADRANVVMALAPEADLILAYHQPIDALNLIDRLRADRNEIPIIILTDQGSEALAVASFRGGAADYFSGPITIGELQLAIHRLLRQSGDNLNNSLAGTLNSLFADAHPDDGSHVLHDILVAAVDVAGADTASILLNDGSGSLYVRASYNMDRQLADELLLPIDDSLAGRVIQTGQPIFINGDEDRKIKTAYLVRSLAYLPLCVDERVVGVLGVDNRYTNRIFHDWQMRSLAVLAELASQALSYAGRYLHVRQERDMLDAILDGTNEPILVTDMAGCLLVCNPSARRLFSIPPNYRGMMADQIDHESIRLLLHVDQAQRAEVSLDDDFVFNAQVTPIPGLGRVIIMQDISHFVELDRMKTNFVANVSQDLRSPLTAILGYVELMSRAGQVNAQQQLFIDRIALSVQSISSLITDLLDLSRIESSSIDIHAETVALSTVVHYALASLEGEIAAKQQKLMLHITDEKLNVRGNAQRLKQMLRNLLQNAIKYTPDGGQIMLRLACDVDLAVLEVVDTGIGISLEDQPHIFDKFYRSDSVRGHYDGTGLGLAIVKSIVDRHHGRVWVRSQIGHGSHFTILLPLYHTGAEAGARGA